MFSGLLYCADCGSKLGYSATNNYQREQAFFFYSIYRSNSHVSSAHYVQEQMERFGLQEKKELTAKRRELDKAKAGVVEIDQLIQKSYEDMTKGFLSEERFATLTVLLEAEQKQLRAAIP